jgi:hypothetical protein
VLSTHFPSTSRAIALRPSLSPVRPRASVIPPWKRSFPSREYSIESPDVTAPNRRASTPESSRQTVAPEMASALRYKSVSTQLSSTSVGFVKIATAATFFEQRVMSNASSPNVAEVQVQWGWANKTNVGRTSSGESFLWEGHLFSAIGFTGPALISKEDDGSETNNGKPEHAEKRRSCP